MYFWMSWLWKTLNQRRLLIFILEDWLFCKQIKNSHFKIKWLLNEEEMMMFCFGFFFPCAAHATAAAQQNSSPSSSQDHQETGVRWFRNSTVSGDAGSGNKQTATTPPSHPPPPGIKHVISTFLTLARRVTRWIPHPFCTWAGSEFPLAASSGLCVQMNKLGPTAFWLPL